METIGEIKLSSFFDHERKSRNATCTAIRKGRGHPVASFLDLATKVAELQFMNRDYVLLFRGQTGDYRNQKGNTSLKPTLFRSINGPEKLPTSDRLTRRFEILKNAERVLVEEYHRAKLFGLERMKRHRIVRWSLLQHYEICKTPLLDVTHSLRIAASFASAKESDKAFIFVLGVPNLSGAVTASAEGGLQIVRLASACPPAAVRPHIQEGYLLGEYPEMGEFSQKENYHHYEIDFGRRLIAKFYFDPGTFWKRDTFPQVLNRDLYPNSADPLYDLAESVKSSIDISED
jgi:hypothetical protein